jgi:DNA-binding XRE family transcriptional regulator
MAKAPKKSLSKGSKSRRQRFVLVKTEGLLEVENRVGRLRDRLAHAARERRREVGYSQSELAHFLGSSQSRISKMEKKNPEGSLELIIKALLAVGATFIEISAVVAGYGMKDDSASDWVVPQI